MQHILTRSFSVVVVAYALEKRNKVNAGGAVAEFKSSRKYEDAHVR